MTLRPIILSLLKNGVPIGSVYEGQPFARGDYAYEVWTEGEYSLVRAVDASPSKQSLLEYAEHKRWKTEVGGVDVAGIPIATDDRSKIMISGARVAAMEDDSFNTPWVTADGNVVNLNSHTIIMISNAVLSHVSRVFEVYSEVVEDIESELLSSFEEVDEAFTVG